MIDPVLEMRQILLSDQEMIAHVMETVSLSDGQVLFHRGDPGDAFYLIEAGQIRIYTLDKEGREMTLNTLSAGETLGEMALLDAQPRSASAMAVGDSTLLRLSRADFLHQVQTSPRLSECVVQILSGRARHMTDYIERLGLWACMVIDGKYNEVIQSIEQSDTKGDRALAAVAGSLRQMVKAVQEREEKLRQEVVQLRIEIDQEKRQRQVEEITGSEGFLSMVERAKQRRRQHAEQAKS